MTIQIAPSILSADFCNLERDLKAISNADLVHVDVMDHHFVPNLTLGEPIVARICEVTDLPVDVHLMIEDPDRWAPEYAKLGAASVSFHMGATHAPVRLARQLREMGCKACFAVRPAEPVEPIFDILDEFDMILIMTVEPGFGGQKFLDNQMSKVRRLRDEITRRGLATKIQVDGGVSPKTAHIVAEAGADVLVAGSAVYGAENPAEASLKSSNVSKTVGRKNPPIMQRLFQSKLRMKSKPTIPKPSRIPTNSPTSSNSKSITFHRMRAMTIQIAPSILSADFCNLERDLKAISNADLVHVDVMDHHFVPNLTLGEPIVARICEVTDLPVDVHLMIEDPDRWAPEYAKLGAASVSFHMGATHAPVRLARQLREMGCKACFAVRPAEPVEPIFDILDEFDMILIMTVEPGFGGQKFLDNQMSKVRRLRDEITRRGLATKIQVDGGVSPKTAHIVAEAGADVLVAGSAVYGAENPAEAIDSIREKAEAAFKA